MRNSDNVSFAGTGGIF